MGDMSNHDTEAITVKFRKGGYSYRYNVEVNGEIVGWVVRISNQSTWSAFRVAPFETKTTQLDDGAKTRGDAAESIVCALALDLHSEISWDDVTEWREAQFQAWLEARSSR